MIKISKKNILKLLLVVIIMVLSIGIAFSAYIYTIYSRNNDVTVVGDIDPSDGLGRQTIDVMKILLHNDIKTNFIGMSWQRSKGVPFDVTLNASFGNKKLAPVVLYEHSLPLTYNEEVYFLNKIIQQDSEKRLYIAYSMFESTKILDKWVRILNTYFDMVVVPSKFLVKVYQDCGVKVPIFYLPLGMNMDFELSKPLKTEKNDVFRFGNFSSLLFRKNHLALIKAFAKHFKNKPNVELIINSRYADEEAYDEIIDYITYYDIQNIKLNIKKLRQNTYNELLSTIDCFVYLSKGEGFSVQPREAMALGVPVIVTDNTAQHDIVESGLVKAVKSDIAVPARYNFTNYTIGNNFDFDIDEAANAMKEVYENYNYYLEQAKQAREWVKFYQYSNLEKKYLNMVKPKKIILGDKNEITKDYLMTDSQELYNKWKHLEKIGELQ